MPVPPDIVDAEVGWVTEVPPVEVVLVVSFDLRLNMVAVAVVLESVDWKREKEEETCLEGEDCSAAKLVRTRRHFRCEGVQTQDDTRHVAASTSLTYYMYSARFQN